MQLSSSHLTLSHTSSQRRPCLLRISICMIVSHFLLAQMSLMVLPVSVLGARSRGAPLTADDITHQTFLRDALIAKTDNTGGDFSNNSASNTKQNQHRIRLQLGNATRPQQQSDFYRFQQTQSSTRSKLLGAIASGDNGSSNQAPPASTIDHTSSTVIIVVSVVGGVLLVGASIWIYISRQQVAHMIESQHNLSHQVDLLRAASLNAFSEIATLRGSICTLPTAHTSSETFAEVGVHAHPHTPTGSGHSPSVMQLAKNHPSHRPEAVVNEKVETDHDDDSESSSSGDEHVSKRHFGHLASVSKVHFDFPHRKHLHLNTNAVHGRNPNAVNSTTNLPSPVDGTQKPILSQFLRALSVDHSMGTTADSSRRSTTPNIALVSTNAVSIRQDISLNKQAAQHSTPSTPISVVDKNDSDVSAEVVLFSPRHKTVQPSSFKCNRLTQHDAHEPSNC